MRCGETLINEEENNEEVLSESTHDSQDVEKSERKAKHAAFVPEYVTNAKNTKRKLKVAIIVLIAIVCVVALLIYFYFTVQQSSLEQNEDAQNSEMSQIEGNDAKSSTEVAASVPALSNLADMKIDDALANVGHGATVSLDEAKDEEQVKRSVKMTLTEDAGGDVSNSPTVILNANSEGNVISITYQAPIKVLGYSTMSFSDAVKSANIIQKTLGEAGIPVEASQVILPDDKSQYTTYSETNNKTSREDYEFSGEVQGKKWSCRLVYDYTVTLATNNLSDTIRNITISISK